MEEEWRLQEDAARQALEAARAAREAALEVELEQRRKELEHLEAQREAELIRQAQEASLKEQATLKKAQQEARDREQRALADAAAQLAAAAGSGDMSSWLNGLSSSPMAAAAGASRSSPSASSSGAGAAGTVVGAAGGRGGGKHGARALQLQTAGSAPLSSDVTVDQAGAAGTAALEPLVTRHPAGGSLGDLSTSTASSAATACVAVVGSVGGSAAVAAAARHALPPRPGSSSSGSVSLHDAAAAASAGDAGGGRSGTLSGAAADGAAGYLGHGNERSAALAGGRSGVLSSGEDLGSPCVMGSSPADVPHIKSIMSLLDGDTFSSRRQPQAQPDQLALPQRNGAQKQQQQEATVDSNPGSFGKAARSRGMQTWNTNSSSSSWDGTLGGITVPGAAAAAGTRHTSSTGGLDVQQQQQRSQPPPGLLSLQQSPGVMMPPPGLSPKPGPAMAVSGRLPAGGEDTPVNKPGFFYRPPPAGGGSPSAGFCPNDTYTVGMAKQKSCRRCPANFVIEDNTVIRNSSSACVAPPGYFVNSAGVALPCAEGNYKTGYNLLMRCSACPFGVTTPGTGSTSVADCNTIQAGFTGRLDNITNGITPTSISSCPQNFYCPRTTLTVKGTESKISCSTVVGGLWTRSTGATASTQCRFHSEPDGTLVAMYLPDGTETYMNVAGSPEACYVEPGYGTIRLSDGRYKAVPCSADTMFGVATRVYGQLPVPCRTCPRFTTTRAAPAELKSSAGMATSPDACQTLPGYGLVNGVLAEQCPQGSWSAGGSREPCQECGENLTTAARGANSSSQCILVPAGEGDGDWGPDCPQGTYKVGGFNGTCTPCPEGWTTLEEGANDSSYCNGVDEDEVLYVSPVTSSPGASTTLDCVTQFGQLVDDPVAPLTASQGLVAQTNVYTLNGCTAACAANSGCQFLVFDYLNSTLPCSIRVSGAAAAAHDNKWYILAFKQIASSMLGAAAVHAKSLGTGHFSYWLDATALQISSYTPSDDAEPSMDTCLLNCTFTMGCYGVRITQSTTRQFDECGYLIPEPSDGTSSLRTLIRAVPERTSPTSV
eukprot:gene10976-11131_t